MGRTIDADTLKAWFKDWSEYDEFMSGYICKLIDEQPTAPSAQPEIIRCKDCKWYGRADKRRFYRGMDCLQNRIDTIIPDKDFCSRAERREE